MTYHIHIQGIVQGVGFRPFIYKLAVDNSIVGTVSNGNDGVNITVNCKKKEIEKFVQLIWDKAPEMSQITKLDVTETDETKFTDFRIIESNNKAEPKLFFAPDFSICDDCIRELNTHENNRFHYPFITCTNCGPRFSIIDELPYDRENTTMKSFIMCPECRREYDNVLDRRYYSQTNSCPDCGISMEIFDGTNIEIPQNEIIDYIVDQYKKGKIISIKGIGGFLITCDASNKETVDLLRKKKNRPHKPFALMYPNIHLLENDVFLSKPEKKEIQSKWTPIVLLKYKESIKDKIHIEGISKDLDRVGVMLPYTPLFVMLLRKFNAPIVATSGNISGSTIIYDNEKAKEELMNISDLLVLNNREIVIPQDDSVIKFSGKSNQRIIIRRSRGLAPSYIDSELTLPQKKIIATGAMLKSVFTIINNEQIYISQFLGNTDIYDAQLNYTHTLEHFLKLLKLKPEILLIDKHPGYFSHIYGRELALKYNIEIKEIQHHKAHFAAVMGEHNLHTMGEKVLGVIFDGTGYGDDGQIWGGEFFIFENGKICRYEHLHYFDFILGDKMVKEPRISALSVCFGIEDTYRFLHNKFSESEWKVYNKLLASENNIKSSSIGRVFDAVSSIILGIDHQSFEGQAAMVLETMAVAFIEKNQDYTRSYFNTKVASIDFLKNMVRLIYNDIDLGISKSEIAAKFHLSIVDYIAYVAFKTGIKKIAFSGGVFQNGLIVELIIAKLSPNFQLYFHNKLSPNDECISFGQVVSYSIK